MKTLKLFNHFLTLIMVLVAIGFSSCSKDEEPETGEQPTEDGGGRRLVSKMEFSSPEDGDWVVRFFYNKDGSLQKITNDVAELSEMTFTRVGNELTIKLDYEVDADVDRITSTLNGDGYVISSLFEGGSSGAYEYQNGFLNHVRYSGNAQWNVTWQNGDIVKVADDDRPTNCTYTNRENKMNVELFDLTYPNMFEDSELYMTSGYWGKRNKHLLKKVEEVDGRDSRYSHEFSYDFDSEGYVTQIFYTMKWEGNGSEQRTWSAAINYCHLR